MISFIYYELVEMYVLCVSLKVAWECLEDYVNIWNPGNTTNNGYIPCLIYKSRRFLHRLHSVSKKKKKKKSAEDYIARPWRRHWCISLINIGF